MIKIAVCDDYVNELNYTMQIVHDILKTHKYDSEEKGFQSADEFISQHRMKNFRKELNDFLQRKVETKFVFRA